jgi:ATP-dependent Lhr-like helicase
LDRRLLEQLVSPQKQEHLLDPRAVVQVERRLRGVGLPPRSTAEMAEWLRRLGDLAEADLEGPMAVFLTELTSDGRAVLLDLPGVPEPRRWVDAEEAATYRQAFGLEEVAATEAQAAGAAILGRFLATHALVGLDDVLRRYPFEADWARRQLEQWAQTGRAVPVRRGGDAGPLEWSAPQNLDQVQRGSLALLRREVTTCPPPQFVDFLLRWQFAHPAARRGGDGGLGEVLARLEGLPLPAEAWEASVLPLRLAGYQPRWLDGWIGGGTGVFVGRGDELAFFLRETVHALAAPLSEQPTDDVADKVRDALQRRGAVFLGDLAAELGLAPSVVRSALWSLRRRGLATNDQFEVARRGEPHDVPMNFEPGPARSRLPSLRRTASLRPEGRWSLLSWGRAEPEAQAVLLAGVLLNRYGVAARELALLDPLLPPWRVLYEVLSRLELAGEVRRGYFVEGLSGAQFALPEAARLLADVDLPSGAAAPAVLLSSLDPANLYGSGAPFDIPLLDGGTRPLLRRAGNWLVLRAGRPVLLAEQGGKKLTALASASRDDLRAAVATLPGLVGGGGRHRLSVEEWNGQPVTTTPGRELLEEAGFVRDLQALTLYKAWK